MNLETDFDSEEFDGIELCDEAVSGGTFSNCTFHDCVFESCTFSGMRFSDCVFQNCKLISNKFVRTTVRGTILDKCAVIGLLFKQITPAGFGSPIDAATGCILKYCMFEKIEMPKVSFRNSDILQTSFTECDLSGCNFSGCSMNGSEVNFCNLSAADLREASGYYINLKNCKVKGASFSYSEALHLLDAFEIKIV